MKTEEFEERLLDSVELLVIRSKELESKIINIPDYFAQLSAIHDKAENMDYKADLERLMEKLKKLEKHLEKQSASVNRQYRFLLFPETNQDQYYKIVFGRLIPWGIFFMTATYLFFLAENGIEAWGNVRYNQQSEQCVRAWLYLNDHASKQVKKAMDQAWVKSSENKDK